MFYEHTGVQHDEKDPEGNIMALYGDDGEHGQSRRRGFYKTS